MCFVCFQMKFIAESSSYLVDVQKKEEAKNKKLRGDGDYLK